MLPRTLDFSTTQTVEVEFTVEQILGVCDFFQSIYIENTSNVNQLVLTFPQSGYSIVVAPGQQGIWPLLVPKNVALRFSASTSTANARIPFIMLNLPYQQIGRLGIAYSPEALAIFAAMTTPPSDARKIIINTLVNLLISSGLWSLFDILYLLAAADSQASLINWKNPGAFTAIVVNTVTFVADRGHTSNGTNGRLRTQFIPSVNGVNYQQNNASLWSWSLTDSAAAGADMGNLTTPRCFFLPRTGGNFQLDVNGSASVTTPNLSTLGLNGASRAVNTHVRAWRNGVQIGADLASASTGLPAQEQWICGGNSFQFSTHQMAMAGWAADLGGLEPTLYSGLLAYMMAVGAA